MKEDLITNTSRRLPIVLCLDISPSMRINRRIENLNEAIQMFYASLQTDSKVQNSAEIAIVTFSTHIEEDTNFDTIDTLANRRFTTVAHGGTNLSAAVLRSIEKLENRRKELKSLEIECYVPFLVLVTDGDPDNTDDPTQLETAIQAVQRHCEKHDGEALIAPYIIGVGDKVVKSVLDRFAEKFTGEAILFNGDPLYEKGAFRELFAFIGDSITNSLHGNNDLRSLYNSLGKSATKQAKARAIHHLL